MLRMALDLAEAAFGASGKQPAYSREALRYLQSQYERLRREETTLRELLEA